MRITCKKLTVQTGNLNRRKIPENITKPFTLKTRNVLWCTCALVQVPSPTEREEHAETYKVAENIIFPRRAVSYHV